MGALLGCGGQCEDECASHCGRDRGLCSACHSGCLTSRIQKPVVQPVSAVQDGIDMPPAKPERYSLAGADCPVVQAVCGDFGFPGPGGRGSDDGLFEDAARGFAELSDQVVPFPHCLSAGRGTADIPNLGECKAISALAHECRYNAGKLRKVHQLSEEYSHWRPVRGDGNCFYRTVAFGALESLVADGAWERVERVAESFRGVEYAPRSQEQLAHDALLSCLDSRPSLMQVESWVSQDADLDQALIRACRQLVRRFLVRNANSRSPAGLTYSELVCALDSTYSGVEDFCALVVDPMGRDAETLALDALPLQLGIGVRTWILDRRDEVGLVSMDTLGPSGEVDVHVLFKPGHYDLLYPRQAPLRHCCGSLPLSGRGGREKDDFEDAVPDCFLPTPAPARAMPPTARGGPFKL